MEINIENIVSFLAKNFYFVIIAAGFLFSIFNQKKRGKTAPRRMPDFGGAGTLGMDRPKQYSASEQEARKAEYDPYEDEGDEDDFWEERDQREQPASNRSFANAEPKDHIRAQQEQLRQKREQLNEQLKRIPAEAASALRSVKDETPQPAAPKLDLSNRTELAKAVLLAEVLGPPRSKKRFK